MLFRLSKPVAILISSFVFCFLGCSGSGSGTTTTTSSGYDMGTLTTVSDTYQFTLANSVSSMVLGISGQSQTAGTSVVQEPASATTSDINWHAMPMGSGVLAIYLMPPTLRGSVLCHGGGLPKKLT